MHGLSQARIAAAASSPHSLHPPSRARRQPADEEAMQAVIITGTFIRRSEGFTPASPVAEVSRERLRGPRAEDGGGLPDGAALQLQHTVRSRPRRRRRQRRRQPQSAQPRRRRHARAAQFTPHRARCRDADQRRRELARAADHDRAHRDPEGRRVLHLWIGCRRRRRQFPHPPQLRRVRGDRPGRYAAGRQQHGLPRLGSVGLARRTRRRHRRGGVLQALAVRLAGSCA